MLSCLKVMCRIKRQYYAVNDRSLRKQNSTFVYCFIPYLCFGSIACMITINNNFNVIYQSLN